MRQFVGWTGLCKVWKMDLNCDSVLTQPEKKGNHCEAGLFAVSTNGRKKWAQWYTSWKGLLNSAKQYGFAGRTDTPRSSDWNLFACLFLPGSSLSFRLSWSWCKLVGQIKHTVWFRSKHTVHYFGQKPFTEKNNMFAESSRPFRDKNALNRF